MTELRIGILAYQGDVREHITAMERASPGAVVIEVRRSNELDGVHGLVIPGGESTTITDQLKRRTMERILEMANGMAVWGTCAGAIAISSEVYTRRGEPDPRVSPLGLMDIATSRNIYGSQRDSFEATLDLDAIGEFPGVFIRAPSILRTWGDAEVLGKFDGSIVMARQGRFLATTFHPELVADPGVHNLFLSMAKEGSE